MSFLSTWVAEAQEQDERTDMPLHIGADNGVSPDISLVLQGFKV